MSTPWPDELIEKIGLQNIVVFRKMSRSAVGEALDQITGITPDERELVLSIALHDDVRARSNTAMTPYQKALEASRVRGIFIAAAWESGASWDSIGKVLNIKRQTVAAAGKKFLPESKAQNKEHSQKFRLGKDLPQPTISTIAAWYNWYNAEIVNSDKPIPSVEKLAGVFMTIVDE